MSNKDDDLDLDMDFEDDSFGDDFDFEPKPVKDDRSPVIKSAEVFKDRFKDTILNEENIRRTLRGALPNEVREPLDHVDQALTEVSGAYHNTVNALRPTVREFKRSARGLKKVLGKVLPERIDKWLDSALEDDDNRGSGTPSADEIFETNLQNTMTEIFKVQEEQRGEERQEDKAFAITSMRQQGETLNATGMILKHIAHMRTLGDTVGINVQKKMLELSMRQFRVQEGIYKRFADYSDKALVAFKDIQKNTALPEIVKRQNKEILKDILTRKFINNAQESLSSKLGVGRQISKFGKHLNNLAQERIVSPLQDLLGSIPMAMDALGQMREMQGGMGLEAEIIESDRDKLAKDAAGMLAESLAGKGMTKGANWLRDLVVKQPKVATFLLKAANFNQSTGRKLNEFWRDGMKEKVGEDHWLYNFFASNANKIREGLDLDQLAASESGAAIKYHSADTLHKSAEFNNFTQKSITEIIPGYLSRILQSSEGIRTGKVMPRLVFDHDRDTFVSTTAMEKDAINEIASYGDSLNRSINTVQEKLLGKDANLSEDEMFGLRKYLVNQNRRGKQLDIEHVLTSKQVPESVQNKIRAYLEKQYGIDEDNKLKLDTDEKIKAVGELIMSFNSIGLQGHAFNEKILDRAKEGVEYTDIMKKLGFVDSNGKGSHDINSSNIYDFLIRQDVQKRAQEAHRKQLEESNKNSDFRQKRNIPNINDYNDVAEGYHEDEFDPSIAGVKTNAKAHKKSGRGRGRARTAGGDHYSVSLSSTTLSHISSIQQNTLQIHKLLEERLVKELNTQSNQVVSGQLEKIDDSINSQTMALLQAVEKLNANIIHIGEMSARDHNVEWTPTDIRPDEITSNLINWNKLARYGRETAKAGVDFVKKAYTMTRDTTKSVWGFTHDKILSPFARLLDKGRQKLLSMDLYFPDNMEEAIVKARDFALGKYVDVQGNVIRSLSDIKGNLYRIAEDGSKQLVVTLEELQNKLVDQYGNYFDITKFTSLTKRAFLGAVDFAKNNLGFLNPMNAIRAAKDFAKKAYYRTKELMMKNVYVGTETTPRITGVQLMMGTYLCQGKPLYRVKDIIDDVMDRNGEVVLSLEEARTKGLFDYKGNPYRDVMDTALQTVGNVLGFGLNIGKMAMDKIKAFGMNVYKFGKGIVSGIFGGMEFSLDINSKWTRRIYELLVWKFGGQPENHKQDIENDEVTQKVADMKKSMESAKEKAEKAMDVMKNPVDAIKGFFGGMKFGGKSVNDMVDSVKNNEKITKAMDKASAKAKELKDKIDEIKENPEATKAQLYDDILTFGKKQKSVLEAKYGHMKDAGVNSLLRMVGGGEFVNFDHMPRDLQIAVGQHHMSYFDKLFKEGPDGSVLVNLKLALKLEAKRLKQIAKAKGYPIGDHRNEGYMEKFLNRFKRKEKQGEKKKASLIARLFGKKEKKSNEDRDKQHRTGIIDRFTGMLRGNSWRLMGRNTNKKKDGKDGNEEKKKPKSMLGKLLGFVGTIAGTLLPAMLKGIMGVPKVLGRMLMAPFKLLGSVGKGLLGVGKFAFSALTGKGSSVAGKVVNTAVRFVGRQAIQMAGRAAISLVSNPLGWAALAVAAVGYGAYKAWEFYRDVFEEVDEYRLAAYGVNANNDQNKSNKILAFEKEMDKVYRHDKYGTLMSAKIDYEKYACFFWDENVNGGLTGPQLKSEQMPRFKDWFTMRFFPLYKRFREALYAMNEWDLDSSWWRDVDGLYDIDSDMKDGYKPAFVRMTMPKPEDKIPAYGVGYFDYEGLPFSDEDTGALKHGMVEHYANVVLSKFKSDEDKQLRVTLRTKKTKDGRFTFEDNFKNRDEIIRKNEEAKKAVWKVEEKDKTGKDIKKVYSTGDKITLTDDKGNKKTLTLDEAVKIPGLDITTVSDLQMIRLSAYGLSPPILPEAAIKVFTMEQIISKGWLRADSEDAGDTKITLVVDKDTRTAFVKKWAGEFGYNPEKQEELDLFNGYLSNRFLPLVMEFNRMMLTNCFESRPSIGGFDLLKPEDQALMIKG